MAEFKQIIDDALDILKFDGAVQDTLAELREKWGAQVPALLDERFDAVGVQYMKLSHEKGAAALGQQKAGAILSPDETARTKMGRPCQGAGPWKANALRGIHTSG